MIFKREMFYKVMRQIAWVFAGGIVGSSLWIIDPELTIFGVAWGVFLGVIWIIMFEY